MDARVALWGLSLVLAACVVTTAETTGPDTLPITDEFYPAGRTLLFSMYSLSEPELKQARADGFTAVGPYYGDREKTIDYARAAGLRALYTIGPRREFDNADPNSEARELESLTSEVARVSEFSELAVWYLANEELRHWRPDEMRWLEAASSIIRATDPKHRPIMMYEPNHRRAPDMAKTSKHLDFATKGAYANNVGMKNNRAWIRWSVEQAVEAATVSGVTPVAVLWMARDQETEADIASIGQWTRHDVYLSLITGAKGILVYSGFNRRPGFRKHFRAFYEGYASAARELNGDLNLGEVFLFGKKMHGVKVKVLDRPELSAFAFHGHDLLYPVVSSLQLKLGERSYFFLVNSASESVRLSLQGVPHAAEVRDVLTGDHVDAEAVQLLGAHEFRGMSWL